MPCIAIKTNGHACGRANTDRHETDTHPHHLELCPQHKRTYNRHVIAAGGQHHLEGRCIHFLTTHRWCTFEHAPGDTLCLGHRTQINRKIARANLAVERRRQVETTLREYRNRVPLLSWQEATREIFHRQDITPAIRQDVAHRYYHDWRAAHLDPDPQWRLNRPAWRFWRYWDWVREGEDATNPPDLENPDAWAVPPMPAPPPARDLARIAGDAQNVHTAAVTRQTNEMEKKLLEVTVPSSQQTEMTIATAWVALPVKIRWSEILKTLNDINRWFNTKSCRSENDLLYKRILRGVVAKINNSEPDLRAELYARLREECFESVGMCCEGHISRLCNVFVGFDEAFKPPVSIGEILQNTMAAIAGLDASEEEKRRRANSFFDQHGTPQEERAAWLEAF